MKTLSVSNRDGEGVQSVRKATLFFFTRKAGCGDPIPVD